MKKIISLLTLFALAPTAHALEFAPGDYEMLPDGKNLFLTYFQYTHSDALYSQGDRVQGDFRLRSSATLLRYIHAWRPQDNISIEPQFILPYASVNAMGDASPLGDSSGIGDLILSVPFKFNPDKQGRDVLSLAPFVYAPTGTYDADKAVNVGENRWRYLLQGVWIHHFSDAWAIETGADVSWVTKNDDYGANRATLQQKPLYQYQTWLRYNLTPGTQFGLGAGWITGAESRVDGVRQDDSLDSTYVRVSASHFVTPSIQLQLSAGRDLTVEQGFRQDTSLSFRVGFLF